MSAKATSPMKPTIQAWLPGWLALPYCAVPVLAPISTPGIWSTRAVPLRTVSIISERSVSALSRAGNGAGLGRGVLVGAGAPEGTAVGRSIGGPSRTRRGVRGVPDAAAAATTAIASGLINTRPWPMASAACSSGLLAGGTSPE